MSLGRNMYYGIYGSPFDYQDHYRYKRTRNIGIQYERPQDILCTCPKYQSRYYNNHRQIYRYNPLRSSTDVDIGYTKSCRRRVKVYLPETEERGVGSADLSPFKPRKVNTKAGTSKRTSSKCIGGEILGTNYKYSKQCLIDKKISPILRTISQRTSTNNVHIETKTVDKNTNNKESLDSKSPNVTIDSMIVKQQTNYVAKVLKSSEVNTDVSTAISKNVNTVNDNDSSKAVKRHSSDSLIQEVYDLENPSKYKTSKTSFDITDARLEKEYRRLFDKSSFESSDMKRNSVFRRRFEALRRIGRKDDSKKILNIPSQTSMGVRKDVSIFSDPPSLEARSISDAKLYSPDSSAPQKPESNIGNEDSAYAANEGAQGMFKVWGKKFNLEDETYNVDSIPQQDIDDSKKSTPNYRESDKIFDRGINIKRDSKRFFFFKKKNPTQIKEKMKSFKDRKGITAGRCEVDRLVEPDGDKKSTNVKKPHHRNHCNQNQSWINAALAPRENQDNLLITWNSSKYWRSSSTVFELMDKVYRQNGLVLKSRSELSSKSNIYKKNYRPTVNFCQEVQAMMLPHIIQYNYLSQQQKTVGRRDNITDKSKAFAQTTKVALHTQVLHLQQTSSDYLTIDLPHNFIKNSEERRDIFKSKEFLEQPSEEVYNIQYETPEDGDKYRDYIKTRTNDANIQKDDSQNTDSTIVETSSKVLRFYRTAIPSSNVTVRIITQSKMRGINRRAPAICNHDDLTDEESNQHMNIAKKSKLAESILQEYYETYMPLGLEFLSWCVSDNQLRQSSERQLRRSFHYGNDASKSCPNINEYYQAPMSSYAASCSGRCATDECLKDDPSVQYMSEKYLKKIKERGDTDPTLRRIMPKDSLDVSKKRRRYSKKNPKKQWSDNGMGCKPSCKSDNAKHVTIPDCPPLPEKVPLPCKPTPILNYRKGGRSANCSKTSFRSAIKTRSKPNSSGSDKSKGSSCNSRPISPTCSTTPKPCPPASRSASPKVKKCSSNQSLVNKTEASCNQGQNNISCSDMKPVKNFPEPCPWPTENNVSKEDLCKPAVKRAPCGKKQVACPEDSNYETASQSSNDNCYCSPKRDTSPDGGKGEDCGNAPPKSGIMFKVIPGIKKTQDNSTKCNPEPLPKPKQTCSAEGMTEKNNYKVQDEDGKTLYERIDYSVHNVKRKTNNQVTSSILDDVYKNSAVNNVSAIKDRKNPCDKKDVPPSSKNKSFSDLLDIFLKIRVKKGDKNTEISIDDGSRTGKCNMDKKDSLNSTDKDVNIKITIRNVSPKSQSMSTCCSTCMVDQTASPSLIQDTGYSVHRATINLTDSCDKIILPPQSSHRKIELETKSSSGLREDVSSDHMTNESLNEKTTDQKENIRSEIDSTVQLVKVENSEVNDDIEKDGKLSVEKVQSHTSIKDSHSKNEIISNDPPTQQITVNPSIKEQLPFKDFDKEELLREKKEIMKEIFEKASLVKKSGNKKNKMRKLRDMLKALMTSESEPEEMTTKNIYIGFTGRNNDSSKCEKTCSNESNIDQNQSPVLYPTRVLNSGDSESNVRMTELDGCQGCVCSKMAERLCCGGSGCACKASYRKSEETACDLETDEETSPNDYTEAGTQPSQIVERTDSKASVSEAKESLEIPVNLCPKTYEPPKNFQMINDIMLLGDSTTKYICSNDEIYDSNEKQTDPDLEAKEIEEQKPFVFETRFVNEDKKYKEKDGQKHRKGHASKNANILQSCEVKKAVLEIYAEKTRGDGKDRLVARLPKFVSDKYGDTI